MSSDPAPVKGPTHIFFLYTDHFEPDYSPSKTQEWADRYVRLAARHRDADGRPPQHTWFYPGEQTNADIMKILQGLVHQGLGEVEMHLHHGFDTKDSLRVTFRDAIEDFQQYGFLKTVDGQTHWAFIHGNFSLDNANSAWLCGVNDEISLLHELGCFCDFTFPSVYENAQPPAVNAIYAAKDDPGPKSYARVYPLSALKTGAADLMIFEGPLVLTPSLNLRHLFLDVEDGDIHAAVPASGRRVDDWIRAGVHVPGHPDWLFVKIYTHGVSSPEDEDAAIGPSFDAALTYLETHYNDGQRYVLHYITARQAYNLAMAAADGLSGDPSPYYDRTIPRYISSPAPPVELPVRDFPVN